MVATLQQHFIPSKVIANGIYHEKTNPLPLLKHKPLLMKKNGGAFICEDKVCKFPTLDRKKALTIALQNKKYSL